MNQRSPELARTPARRPYGGHLHVFGRDGDRGYDWRWRRRWSSSRAQLTTWRFLGIESVRGADGLGITVSYWRDEASILAWKRDTEHQQAQRGGEQGHGTSTTRCASPRWSAPTENHNARDPYVT